MGRGKGVAEKGACVRACACGMAGGEGVVELDRATERCGGVEEKRCGLGGLVVVAGVVGGVSLWPVAC